VDATTSGFRGMKVLRNLKHSVQNTISISPYTLRQTPNHETLNSNVVSGACVSLACISLRHTGQRGSRYRQVGLCPILTFALDGHEWSALHHRHFISGKSVLNVHWIWDRVGSRSGLIRVARRIIPASAGNRMVVIRIVVSHFIE